MADNPTTRFAWVADAPLFIDAPQIERFFDAVVRPTYVEGATAVTVGNTGEVTFGGEAGGEGTLKLGGGLLELLGGVKGELKLGGKGTTSKKKIETDSRQTQWIPIRTPQRQLGLLIYHYLTTQPHRLLEFGPTTDGGPLFEPTSATSLPRALVVLDLPGMEMPEKVATRLYPMAAELTNGTVAQLYSNLRQVQMGKLVDELGKGGVPALDKKLGAIRPLGGSTAGDPASVGEKVQRSWEQLDGLYDPWDAMRLIEEAVGEQRIRWIDFQMAAPITAGRKKIHLHVCPGGEFDTGVFCYNFTFRAFHYGVRIVATLKSGPDLNVLAIYEK